MACNYLYTRGFYKGTRCGEFGCSHPKDNRYIIVNISPCIMLDTFKHIPKQYLTYKKMYEIHGKIKTALLYNNYSKWIYFYMFCLDKLGHVSHDIFSNFIYYYIS